MALPWLESRRVWGDTAKEQKQSSEAPTRMAILFAGCGFHSKEWWAKGSGESMELGKVLKPLADYRDRMLFIQGLYNAEALQGKHPQLTDRQPAVGCAVGFRWTDSLGNECRSGGRSTDRRPNQVAQPGNRLREIESVGSQELFDAVQLAHFVEQSDHADATGSLSGSGL